MENVQSAEKNQMPAENSDGSQQKQNREDDEDQSDIPDDSGL